MHRQLRHWRTSLPCAKTASPIKRNSNPHSATWKRWLGWDSITQARSAEPLNWRSTAQIHNVRDNHRRALAHFNQAVSDWEAYAQSATSQYNPQLFSRTHYMDWWKILEDVKKEALSVQAEETNPKKPTRHTAEPSPKGLSE